MDKVDFSILCAFGSFNTNKCSVWTKVWSRLSLDLPSLWNQLLHFQLNIMRLVLNLVKKLLDVSRISFYFYFTISNYIILIQNKHIGYILWSDASCKALFCCASGPSESQLQTMWWKAEFLSVNWVVCLSHWIHLPGKRSRCCTKTGKRRSVFTLKSWLFFLLFFVSSPSSSPPVWEHVKWKQRWTNWLTGVSQELRGQPGSVFRILSLFWGWRTDGQPSLSVASTPR